MTASVQLVFAARDDVHVVAPAMANSAAGAAVFDVSVIAVVVLVFVSVTVLQGFGEPFATVPQVAEEGEMVRVDTAATPLPVRFTVCGEPGALSVIVSVPVAGPVETGLKKTATVHDVLIASVVLHVVSVISTPNGLVAFIAVKVSGPVPLLVIVTCWHVPVPLVTVSAQVIAFVESVAVGCVPVPLSATVWGLPGALSPSESVPVRGPVAVGVKSTYMIQVALFAASDAVHALVPPVCRW